MEPPFLIKTCFAPRYYADTPTASMRKLPVVAALARELGCAELIDPGTIDPEKLRRLHEPIYVNAFLEGRSGLASAQGWQWSAEIRDGVLAIQAGQLRAAELALDHGIAANVAQGFHHARYATGAAFCTFNGLALVAQEFPNLKVGVLDCDEHQGDGTASFTEQFSNLFNFTIFGTSMREPEHPRSINRHIPNGPDSFDRYIGALEEGFDQLLRWGVDLVIYQAGVDSHIEEPMGRLGLTTEQIWERDYRVFHRLREARLPVFFVLAGGYQEPIEETLATLHVNTFRAAAMCFGNSMGVSD